MSTKATKGKAHSSQFNTFTVSAPNISTHRPAHNGKLIFYRPIIGIILIFSVRLDDPIFLTNTSFAISDNLHNEFLLFIARSEPLIADTGDEIHFYADTDCQWPRPDSVSILYTYAPIIIRRPPSTAHIFIFIISIDTLCKRNLNFHQSHSRSTVT